MSSTTPISYTMKNEIEFIRNLGMHFGPSRSPEKEAAPSNQKRVELLLSYINGCKQRTDMDGLDREACIMEAQAEITRIREGVPA